MKASYNYAVELSDNSMGKQSKNVVLKSRNIYYYAFICSLVYFFYNDFFEKMLTSRNAGIMYVVCILCLWLICIYITGKVNLKMNVWWLLALIVMVASNREEIGKGKFYWCTIYVVLTFLLFFLPTSSSWVIRARKSIPHIGGVHIFATIILFLCSPWLYRTTMYLFWGTYPGGVVADAAYSAGLSRHYSQNAIFCTVVLLYFGTAEVLRKTHRPDQILKLGACIFALFLTTKRAHILFSFLALMVVYYFCADKKTGNKLVNVMLAAIVIPVLVILISPIVPVLDALVQRFVGVVDISNGRYDYWAQAFELFQKNKLTGIGWGQYVYLNRYGTGVHNTYLQLLCETGIVGFLIFVVAMYSTYIIAVRDYSRARLYLPKEETEMLAFSIGIQTYTLAYCMTGNCFYDISVIIYYLACAISLTYHNFLKKRVNEQNHKIHS